MVDEFNYNVVFLGTMHCDISTNDTVLLLDISSPERGTAAMYFEIDKFYF